MKNTLGVLALLFFCMSAHAELAAPVGKNCEDLYTNKNYGSISVQSGSDVAVIENIEYRLTEMNISSDDKRVYLNFLEPSRGTTGLWLCCER